MDITFPTLYRARSRKAETSIEDKNKLQGLLEDLNDFKTKVILKYSLSYARSRVVENIQGLIDLIKARAKKKKASANRERI